MDEIRKRIKSADAVAAYEVLLKGMTDLGLECRRPRKGFVKSANFWRERWYPFSIIANQADLLFYIRTPALRLRSGIREIAEKQHPGEVNTGPRGDPAENKAKEVKVRVRSASDAMKLLEWLGPIARQMRDHA